MPNTTLPEAAPADTIVDAEVVEEERDWFKHLPYDSGVNSFFANASSVDELLADVPEAQGLRDFTGRALTIHGASLRQGQIDDRTTWYVVIDATDHTTGDRVALTTGAEAVMRQLSRAAELDLFPFDAMPYEVALDRKGRSNPLHLGKTDRF